MIPFTLASPAQPSPVQFSPDQPSPRYSPAQGQEKVRATLPTDEPWVLLPPTGLHLALHREAHPFSAKKKRATGLRFARDEHSEVSGF